MVGDRQMRIGAATLVMVATAAAAGGAIGFLTSRVSEVATSVIAIMALAGAFVAMLPRWRRLDHMEQDSRLRCWYWGGGFGGSLALLLALIWGGSHSQLFQGAGFALLAQIAGNAVWRARWWLVHRAAAA